MIISTVAKRSAIMKRVRGKNTSPERSVRGLLGNMGFGGYKLHKHDVPGTPDFVWPRHMLVLFVNGCFWHGHRCHRGARMPKTNRNYWSLKIANNKKRDTRQRSLLRTLGFRVLTVWECELKNRQKLRRKLARFLH